MYDICDIHSHILPGMDDGCQTVEESTQVMQLSFAGGVGRMVATPHYNPNEPVEDFLKRRDESERRLREYLASQTSPVPEFCCGAEVAYIQGISQMEGLERLCLGNSRYLLLELPRTLWTGEVIRDLDNLHLRGLIPILAHIERYYYTQSKHLFDQLLQRGPLVQMNAEHLLRFRFSGKATKLLKKNIVHLLGSDCHGPAYRPPNLGEAVALLEKKRMHNVLFRIEDLSDEIFRDATR